jgi:hypothetical protein
MKRGISIKKILFSQQKNIIELGQTMNKADPSFQQSAVFECSTCILITSVCIRCLIVKTSISFLMIKKTQLTPEQEKRKREVQP